MCTNIIDLKNTNSTKTRISKMLSNPDLPTETFIQKKLQLHIISLSNCYMIQRNGPLTLVAETQITLEPLPVSYRS